MASSATVLYGFEIDRSSILPERIHTRHENGMMWIDSIALYLREEFGTFDKAQDYRYEEVGPFDCAASEPQVGALLDETRLWLETWNGYLFLTTKYLHWHQQGISRTAINMRMPSDAEKARIQSVHTKLSMSPLVETRWYFLTDEED